MKLLYIIPFIPYPLTTGGNQAFFTITDHIRKNYDISLLLYVHTAKDKKNIDELKALWPDVTFYVFEPTTKKGKKHLIPVSPFEEMKWVDKMSCRLFDFLEKSMKRKIERCKRKYAIADNGTKTNQEIDFVRSNSSLYLTTDDFSPSYCQYVEEVSRKGFDVIQVEFYDYLRMVHLFPKNVKTVFIHHELRFVRNENELSLFKQQLPEDKLLFEKEKALELSDLAHFDAVVTLTEIDKQILSNYLPADRIFVSPAITQSVSYEHKAFQPATELVFVGSGDHFPNADAMVWFCKEVLPIIRKKLPMAPKVNIIGHWDKNLMLSLSKLGPEINFPGFVDDLQSFVNGKISIVPIRIGSGMRMKILDSIFAAAPIVTSSKGCEGLPMIDNENCLLADDKEAFANAVVRMLSDVALQERLAMKAQHSKTSMLNEQELFEKRIHVYKSLLS